MDKTAFLETVNGLITGPRSDSYGSFSEQMQAICNMMEAICGKAYEPQEIALMLICLKLRRFGTAQDIDSLLDLAGYTALLAEMETSDG